MGKIIIHNTHPRTESILIAALERLEWSDLCAFDTQGEPGLVTLQHGDQNDIKTSDVFAHPIRLGALLDRLRFHIQGGAKEAVQDIEIGPFTLPAYEYDLKHENGNDSIRLTDKERDILVFLKTQNGREVQRTELLSTVWGYVDSVETHTLETHIYRLRQKIEEDPANPVFLITTESGYVLRA